MGHPFRVGGTYTNRKGKYEVVELDGSEMVIRYNDGSQVDTTVKLQWRILKNMQAEEEREPRTETASSSSRPKSRKDHRGRKFETLHDSDFKNNVAGTHWRARTGLGGLLTRRLSEVSGRFFQSWAIYRQPAVHIAQPSHYDPKAKWQQAKFVFQVNPEGATYGFYIEKNEGPMDDTWDWPRFLSSLERDEQLRTQVGAALRQLGLHWEVYVWDDGGLVAQVRASQSGFLWEWESIDESEDIEWLGFTERLRAIEADKWCDLYLCMFLSKADAIAAGLHVVEPVIEVYRALLPLYEASTPRHRSESS